MNLEGHLTFVDLLLCCGRFIYFILLVAEAKTLTANDSEKQSGGGGSSAWFGVYSLSLCRKVGLLDEVQRQVL